MAVNKNFVVKNGLEVKSNLLVADTSLDSVGIGTSFIKEKLHVQGGIGATTLFVGGIGTVHVATGNTARYENLNVTGLGTIATLSSNSINVVSLNASGIVTANKYFGDGSTLTGVSVGVRTEGAVLGYGVTFLDIRGSGVSTAFFNTNVGIATLFFEGGGSGGSVSISSDAPSNPNNGDLWYSIDFGRTFVYYDEVELGVGSTSVWVDASPFNNGGSFISAFGGTAHGAIGYTAGTASSTSIFFTGDPDTGVFQPSSNQVSISAGGVGVATFNPGGFFVGGAATVTSDLSVSGNLNVTGDLVYDEERGANVLISGVGTATGFNVLGITSVKDLNVVGVATIATLNATTVTPENLTLQTGVTTNATNTNLTVTGITTIVDSKTQTGVTTNLTATNLTVTGITTLASATVTATSLTAATGVTTNATNTLLKVTGVSTFASAATFSDDVTFTGAAANVTWDKSVDDLIFGDNAKAAFGASSDLTIYHDSSHSYISDQGTGSLKVLSSDFQVNNAANAENMITASEDGAAALYYNGTSRIQTTNTGSNVTGVHVDDGATHDGDVTFTGANYNVVWDKSADELVFLDNAQAHFGTGGDLKLYHDGSNSYIQHDGTGNLIIYGSGETLATFADDGAVSLYFDNTSRIQTKGDGVNVTGNIDCDSFNNAGITTLGSSLVVSGGFSVNSGTVTIPDTITHDGDTNTKIRFPAVDTISAETAGEERLRINVVGDVLVGTSTSRTINSHVPKLQVTGYDYGDSTVSIINNEANANGAFLFLGKQRSGGPGGSAVVADDDVVGQLRFNVGDGTDMESYCAQIQASIDGTPGGDDVPGRLTFSTTADGGNSPTERARITSGGDFIIGDTSGSHRLTVQGSGTEIARFLGANGADLRFRNSASNDFLIYAGTSDSLKFGTNGQNVALTLDTSQDATFAGSVSDHDGDLRSIPLAQKTSAYVLVAADAGRAIHITTGGVTVNNSVFSAGHAVTIINDSGSDQTITQGSGLTMYNSADASTGNRTLAGRGMCTIWFNSASKAYISGAGLS